MILVTGATGMTGQFVIQELLHGAKVGVVQNRVTLFDENKGVRHRDRG